MQITKRSILAISIAALLSACGSDDSGNSGAPVKPEPLKPQPAQTVDVAVGNANVKAMKESLVITTAEGEEKLGSVESFKGITFAEAARFVRSKPVDFSGDIDATQFGDACPQIKATTQAQSEDCLNLNIWRPVGTVQGEDLPVYVFIHGGDFEYGSGANPMIHGDKVVAQGADEGNPFIAVTFNYRLGLLGSSWVKGTDKDDNGNYGLGDQETLLKWVQDNIQDFGGNAGNVTLMGQGSGAMSIALLQQKVAEGELEDTYFQRAIMQSMPYGFEYKSYNVAKDQAADLDNLRSAPLEQVLETQSETLDPLQRLENWLLSSLDFPIFSPESDNTPMATLMPYAPYLECSQIYSVTGSCKDEMGKPQPSQENFVVPTVIGVNAKDSGSMSFLPNLMSLVPLIIDLMGEDTGDAEYTAQRMAEWLSVDGNKQLVEARIQTLASSDEFSAPLALEDLIEQLPKSAYEAITPLFFGLKNDNDTGSNLLALADFYPNDEHELSGAFDNMGQYRTIMKDMLFTGPARLKAAQSEAATMYYFNHSPSFNIWTYNTGPDGKVEDLGDLLKSISCITGACNGSELPFVFNKAVKMDGTETHPSSKDKKLMNEMSRVWFSDELFSDYQYDATQDSILLIDENGVHLSAQDWDRTENKGIDAKLRNGRLSGLEDQGILMNYLQD